MYKINQNTTALRLFMVISCYRGLMFSMNTCTRGQRNGLLRASASSSHRVQQSHTTIDSRRRLTRMHGSPLPCDLFFFAFIVVIVYLFAPCPFMVGDNKQICHKQNANHEGNHEQHT